MYCLWSGCSLIISMGGSANRDSGSAQAVCALNMMELELWQGHHGSKKQKRLQFLIARGGTC